MHLEPCSAVCEAVNIALLVSSSVRVSVPDFQALVGLSVEALNVEYDAAITPLPVPTIAIVAASTPDSLPRLRVTFIMRIPRYLCAAEHPSHSASRDSDIPARRDHAGCGRLHEFTRRVRA